MRYWLTICLGLGVAPLGVGQELKPGDLIWETDINNWNASSPAIGSGGSIIGLWDDKVYALDGETGVKKWEFNPKAIIDLSNSPAIGEDGSIYFCTRWSIYALHPDGTEKWKTKGEYDGFFTGSFMTSPAVGKDGTIYVLGQRQAFNKHTEGTLFALDGQTGKIKWHFSSEFSDGDPGGPQYSCPVIGLNGTVYVYMLLMLEYSKLYAIDGQTGEKKWRYETGGDTFTFPAIGADGTVYMASGRRKFSAINGLTGAIKWELNDDFNDHSISSRTSAIGADGTIYIPCYGSFFALDGKTGAKKWEFESELKQKMYKTPAIGDDGTVYITASGQEVVKEGKKEWLITPKIIALDEKTGNKKWEFESDDYFNSSPIIGDNGNIVIFGGNKAYSIKTSSSGPAHSSWPMQRQNAQGNARTDNLIRVFVDGTTSNGQVIKTADAVTVRITTGHENGEIFYTLDGTTPSFTSNAYVEPFELEKTSIIRAIAYSEDFTQSIQAEAVTVKVLPTYSLNLNNPGGGIVSADPPNGPYLEGTEVTLTAQPSGKWDFIEWTGDATGADPTITITMDGPKTLTPVFGTTVTINEVGSGTVIQEPPNPVPYGGTVKLRAIPDEGHFFFRWAGVHKGTGNPGQFPVTEATPVVTGLFVEAKPGEKLWRFRTGATVYSSPAIGSDGTIYIGSQDNNVYAFNPDGTKKWAFRAGSVVWSSPAIGSDGTIYIGAFAGKVYAINPDGTKKWEFETGYGNNAGGIVTSSPSIGPNGTVYIGADDSNLYALNGQTGAKIWEFKRGNKSAGTLSASRSKPAIGADNTVYIGSDRHDHKVYALDGKTGDKKWEFQAGGPVHSSPSIGSSGTVYIGSDDRKVYALNGKTGTKIWEFKTGWYVRSSASIGSDNTVYIASDKVYALHGQTGDKIWEFEIEEDGHGFSESTPAIGNDGTVYIGSQTIPIRDGKIICLDGESGEKLWGFTTGGLDGSVTSSPAIGANGTVYVGSCDYFVYALKSSSTGPLDSPWPMFGKNTQRTARVQEKPTLSPPVISSLKLVDIEGAVSIKFTFDRQPLHQYVIQKSKDLKNWKDDGPPIAAMPIASIYRFSRTIDTWPGEKLFYRVLVE